MLRHLYLASLLSFCSLNLMAQQAPALSTHTHDTFRPSIDIPPSPLNRAEYIASVRKTYYHPDGLSGLNCNVTVVNWVSMLAVLNNTAPPDFLKALQTLAIHVETSPKQLTKFTFDWSDPSISKSTKERMVDDFKDMMSGFLPVYWSTIADFPISNLSDIGSIEPQPDGGSKIYLPYDDYSAVLTTDKQRIPTQFAFENPIAKVTTDFGYTPSPNSVPGDLRRITSVKISRRVGTSTTNLSLYLDYQPVGGFFVPFHVTFSPGDAYSIKMEFYGCTVSREITHSPEKKPTTDPKQTSSTTD